MKGFDVFIAPIQDDPVWRAIEMSCELVDRLRIDLIHANLMNAQSLAGVVAKMTGIPSVATIHSMQITAQELSIARHAEMHLITVCQQARSQAMALGLSSEAITLINNGVDLDRFRPLGATPVLREKHAIGPDAPIVGFVGRLAWEKGPDKFVEMAVKVAHEDPSPYFFLIGEGPLREKLQRMINAAGLSKRIFLTGLIADTSCVYSQFDIFVQTSRTEGMPLALLEAMACGNPTIAIGVGGVPEVIEAGVTGMLIPPGPWPGVASQFGSDWEGCAEATLHLLRDGNLRRSMGNDARLRAVSHYSLDQTAQQTGALFERLVSVPQWGRTNASARGSA